MHKKLAVLPLIVVAVLSLLSFARVAYAASEDDCPIGSKQKTEDGFTWCQPSVCLNDTQCDPSETCRPVPLCMEVGTLTDAGLAGAMKDGGKQRLAVTQRCAPDKTCPQKQTCSDISRCISKVAADKMGAAASPATSSSTSPTTTGEPAAKKSCGCRAVGSSSSSPGAPLAGLALAIGLALRRRRLVDRR